MRRACLAPLLVASMLLAGPRADAGDKIWSAVLIASNVENPKEPPPQLRRIAARLKRVFGYNQFEICGAATEEIDVRVERWLVPTKRFWLSVKARRSNTAKARGGYLLNVQFFHDKRQLVETEAMLAPDSPFFIRGPMHARGQVIVVLEVQP